MFYHIIMIPLDFHTAKVQHFSDMTKCGGIFFFIKKASTLSYGESFIPTTCVLTFFVVSLWGGFYKKIKLYNEHLTNPHHILYLIYGSTYCYRIRSCCHSGGNDMVHKKGGRPIIFPPPYLVNPNLRRIFVVWKTNHSP